MTTEEQAEDASAEVEINSEYAAQASGFAPNPALTRALERLSLEEKSSLRIADQGCGKLRHFEALAAVADEFVLVDTRAQIERSQKLFDSENITLREYHEEELSGREDVGVRLFTAEEFGKSNLELDAVFSVCVMDVVEPETREELFRSASRNLRRGGVYVVIAARNDTSILQRCTEDRRHKDGYIFERAGGIVTFFRNFREVEDLLELGAEEGFSLENDLSRYRQVCLIFRKEG